MARVFRPSNRESRILSRIESSKEFARRQTLQALPDCVDRLANSVAMKLVENGLVETTNKNGVEDELKKSLETLCRADDFDIDYQTSPFRRLVPHPHTVSLYLTAFVIEKLIHHRDVIDIFGDDLDIYQCIHEQVKRILP